MKSVLKLPAGLFEDLGAHLLPPENGLEQAVFLFVASTRVNGGVSLEVLDCAKLASSDFDVQTEDYLELSDDARARLIKRAHSLNAALVELHSHRGPWPAAFSFSDRAGLREIVPHVWWRLPGRPYLAIVIAPSGFDALLWVDDPHTPQRLDALLAGERLLRPTHLSLEDWHD